MSRTVCACHYYPLELCPGEEAVKISDDELEKLIVEFEGLPDMMTPEGREHYYALCELQSLRAEVTKLRADSEILRTAGIVEVSVRNASVREYMLHWETRTRNAEVEVEKLRAEVTKRHEANRWNAYRDGDALMVCLGDHEKHEDCTVVRYVPESEVSILRADVAELESNLSVSAKSEKYLYDRVDTLTRCILVEIAALEHNQRGSTHWEGCESRHHDCAAIKRMRAAIDAAGGAT